MVEWYFFIRCGLTRFQKDFLKISRVSLWSGFAAGDGVLCPTNTFILSIPKFHAWTGLSSFALRVPYNTPYHWNEGRCIFRIMKKTLLNFLVSSASLRTVRQFTPVLACCGALGLLAGCASEPDSHVVSAPPPPAPTSAVTTTTTTTAPVTAVTPVIVDGNTAYVPTSTTTPVVSTTVVTQAPPTPQQDVVSAQPSPKHVWLAGYWTWRNDQYQWMAGHWELPPNVNSTWVAPRWEQQGNSYKFYEGYWD